MLSAGWFAPALLIALVAGLLGSQSHPRWRRLFAWLPLPLWCYGVPMLLRAVGVLPPEHPAYHWITEQLFPVALALLLLGIDLPSLRRLGGMALAAMAVGSAAIVLGGPLMWWIARDRLPPEAWKGISILAATWTGGSLNMLAVRAILNVPDTVFAPLVVIDAIAAYSWMACLIWAQSAHQRFDRWLKVPAQALMRAAAVPEPTPQQSGRIGLAVIVAIGMTIACRMVSGMLPVGGLVSSRTGWTVLLITTLGLALTCVGPIQPAGRSGTSAGYGLLYVVLASLGAQASVKALAATPMWLVVAFGWIALHGLTMLLAGRMGKIPLGMLATASQANIGGVVSAPLVGAVYDPSLAAAGLLLALLGNALGTYLGLVAATLCRWLGAA